MMTVLEFSRLLEVYGADMARWPVSMREDGLTLLAADADAQGALAEAKALDDVLAEAPRGTVTKALEDSILARFDAQRSHVKPGFFAALWPQGPAWVPASAFAVSLMLGVMCASFVPGMPGAAPDELADVAGVNFFGPLGDEGLASPSGAL